MDKSVTILSKPSIFCRPLNVGFNKNNHGFTGEKNMWGFDRTEMWWFLSLNVFNLSLQPYDYVPMFKGPKVHVRFWIETKSNWRFCCINSNLRIFTVTWSTWTGLLLKPKINSQVQFGSHKASGPMHVGLNLYSIVHHWLATLSGLWFWLAE